MTQSSHFLLQKQYDSLPYPQIPIEQSPQGYYDTLFIHDLRTPYYLYQQKKVNTQDKLILDAGCGSGWTSLFLAYANPGAKIIGIDLSSKSIEVAKTRLNYHGFTKTEFYPLSIDDLQQLNCRFDYINCDEVIYLLPEPQKALQIFQSVLNENGIVRVNFHSYYQRFNFFRMQKLFEEIGLLNENPEDFEIELVKETMDNLTKSVIAKQEWQNKFLSLDSHDSQPQNLKEAILVNYLLQGDKGYTIPQVFTMLKQANLDFLSMVKWRHWNIRDLFKNPNSLPDMWEMGLAETSVEQELHLYELLNPVHRLIDFWCVKRGTIPSDSNKLIANWDLSDWYNAKIYLHPQIKSPLIKTDLLKIIETQEPFLFNRYITFPSKGNVQIESNMASCLLILWEQETTSLRELVERWLKIQPVELISLQPKSESTACQELIEIIIKLENFLYILVEQSFI